MSGIWAELGVPADSDRDTIRRAYARKLRVTNPEDDPEGFKRLREAYDSALAHVEYVARWGDDDADDEDEDMAPDVTLSDPTVPDLSARADPSLLWQDVPDATGPSTEARTLLAGRDSDLAALRRAMADLDSALRGAWRAPDAEIEALFDAILRAPALGEIMVRSDVEAWAAELIADTIPRSDAILTQAVTAFGWSVGGAQHGGYAVHAVLERLDEWRLIAALARPGHTLNPAWQSLTKPPVRQPWWRLKALSPDLTHGVRSLLGDFGYVSPGLRFSFNAESVERWCAFFTEPRLTLGMLLLAFAVWSGLNAALGTVPALGGRVPYWSGAIILVLSVAAPVATLRIVRWSHASSGVAHAALARGWLPAFAVLGLIAILLPAEPASAIAVTLGSLVVLGWFAVATDPHAPTSFWGGAGRWLIGGWLYLILGVPVTMRMVPPATLILADIAVLAFILRTTMIDQLRTEIDQVAPARPMLKWLGTLVALAVLAGLATAARLALYHGGDGAMFIGGTVTLLLVLPGLAVFGPLQVRWVVAAHVALAVAFVIMAGPLLPDTPARSVSSPSLSSPVPLAATPGAPTDPKLSLDEQVALAMRASALDLPGMRENNPATYKAIADLVRQRSSGAIGTPDMYTRINDTINESYRTRIRRAPTALVAEDQRISLDHLREVRAVSVAACARNDVAASTKPSKQLQKRVNVLIYAVVSSPPATAGERTRGRPLSVDAQVGEAARIAGQPRDRLIDRLVSKAETAAVCEARVAMQQALTSHIDDDVAATIRARNANRAASAR